MKDQARVVVIGGGITGCSVLYHLAKAGWTDVVLIEKGELTSGATCHAAGMLTQFNTSPTIMRMRQYSARLYHELNAYSRVGSVNMAASPEMLKTLQRNVSRAKGIGLNVDIISPQETLKLIPWISSDHLSGSVYLPEDGHIDPHETTYTVAKAAIELGAVVYTRTRVTGIDVSASGEISGVKTDKGDIRCEAVINAAGIWGAQVAAMAGIVIPSTPVIHQHIALEPVAGHEVPGESPTFRDYDYLVYGRPESGGYLVGGWELDPPACWIDGVPWDHEAADLPNDFDRFAPMLEDTIKRMPFLADAGMIRLVAHPDAFSPDAAKGSGWPAPLQCRVSAAAEGSANQWPNGSSKGRRNGICMLTGPGALAAITMIPFMRRKKPVNAINIIIIPTIPTMKARSAGRGGSVPCIKECRTWERFSVPKTAGSGSTTSIPIMPGG
jgi:4-methylaminobutanoate oxidase (formaldehyde-forming)